MMEDRFDVTVDGEPARLSVSGSTVYLDDAKLEASAVSLGRKRRFGTFHIIIALLAVLAAGMVLYAIMNTALGSDDDGRPYKEIDDSNTISFRTAAAQVPSPIFLVGPSQPVVDLSGSVDWRDEDRDTVRITGDAGGERSLMLMWYGNADDLITRHISVLLIEVDSADPYRLDMVRLVKLGEDRTVIEHVSFTDGVDTLSTRTGNSVFEVNLDDLALGQARNMQSGEVSSRKGCQVAIYFPQGLSSGEMDISISFGPDYYHENSGSGIIAGGISAVVTIIASVIVYKSMSRENEVLVLEAGGKEYTLGGEGEDLNDAYLRISKIVIPKMKETTGPENMRPGVTLGRDLIDEDEAEAIGKQLKRRPGGSGKMIVHQCPECLGTELYYESGFMTGYKYHCKNCDYVGSFVIEKQVDFDR